MNCESGDTRRNESEGKVVQLDPNSGELGEIIAAQPPPDPCATLYPSRITKDSNLDNYVAFISTTLTRPRETINLVMLYIVVICIDRNFLNLTLLNFNWGSFSLAASLFVTISGASVWTSY